MKIQHAGCHLIKGAAHSLIAGCILALGTFAASFPAYAVPFTSPTPLITSQSGSLTINPLTFNRFNDADGILEQVTINVSGELITSDAKIGRTNQGANQVREVNVDIVRQIGFSFLGYSESLLDSDDQFSFNLGRDGKAAIALGSLQIDKTWILTGLALNDFIYNGAPTFFDILATASWTNIVEGPPGSFVSATYAWTGTATVAYTYSLRPSDPPQPSNQDNYTVPEPATGVLFALGLASIGFLSGRQSKNS